MKQKNTMELIAPAGEWEALRAAVCAGADAVYLGTHSFGARASAANFDGEELARAVEYAHFHHVRIYVTVNTLIKERELPAVMQTLETIAMAQADAVIAQDLGVAALVKEYFPALELHASTQMALHNATGMRWAQAQGIERVVLARECSLADIQKAAETGMEVEVFVHGALCAGVSGQCLLSSLSGGRSGNRGRCAQPCRQNLSLGERGGALLSMKDLCLRDHLPELLAAGVGALKIEGRLKRPEYVAIVTESYRRALDEMAQGRFRPGDALEKERLMQIFHRGGFTCGHAVGAEDADLCATDHVGHGGMEVGQMLRVKNELATLALVQSLHDGDGLQLRGRQEADLRYSGKERSAGEEAVLRLRPGVKAMPGDKVYRLTDMLQMAEATALIREKPIEIFMEAVLEAGKPMRLTMEEGSACVRVEGEVVQAARTRATTEEEVLKQLAKLGDTPFVLSPQKPIALSVGEDIFVPVSGLNALRREGVQALIRARGWAFAEKKKSSFASEDQNVKKQGELEKKSSLLGETKNLFAVRFGNADMGKDFAEAGAELLLFAPMDIREASLQESLSKLPAGAWVELPVQLTEAELSKTGHILKTHASHLGGVVVGSVGQLGASFGLPVALGAGIPFTNRKAMEAFAQLRPAFGMLWPELSLEELLELRPFEIPVFLTVYGREGVMWLNHCPERVGNGSFTKRASCNLCKAENMACGKETPELVDRKGFRFPLQKIRTEEGCLVKLLNALPIDLSRQEEARKALGAGMLINLTVETPEEQMRLVQAWAAVFRGEGAMPYREGKATQGHFFRGVE